MKHALCTAFISLALVAAGTASVGCTQVGEGSTVKDSGATVITATTRIEAAPRAITTALIGFPDIDYVPIYPGASITRADPSSIDSRVVWYEVGDSIDQVMAFYQDRLKISGWALHWSDRQMGLYEWTDSTSKPPSHLQLEVSTDPSLDGSKTVVSLVFGRYPEIRDGLPIYPDAQQPTTKQLDMEVDFLETKLPAHITEASYLSNARLDEIAAFYSTTLAKYGWFSFDPSLPDPYATPTGNLASHDGLHFKAGRSGWEPATGVSDQLDITATTLEGQTLVKLRAQETDVASIGNW